MLASCGATADPRYSTGDLCDAVEAECRAVRGLLDASTGPARPCYPDTGEVTERD